MDVTCTAKTLIYLIICFLPFYAIVSFHFSVLLLYIFFFFLPFSFFYPPPPSPRPARPIFFLLPILGLRPSTSYSTCLQSIFSLWSSFSCYWALPFLLLCRTSVPDRQTCAFIALFAAFQIFLSIIPFLFRSTPGAVWALSEKSPQDQGAASYHVLQKIDAEDRLVVCNTLFCLLSALTFESIAVTFTDGFQFKSWVFFFFP